MAGGEQLFLLILLPLAALSLLVGFFVLMLRPKRGRAAQWRRAASELGMVDVQLIVDVIFHLAGRVGRHRVTVEESSSQGTGGGTTPITDIVVEGGLPADVTLRPEGAILGLVPIRGGMTLGDPEFDPSARVVGPPATVLALLDHVTRRELLPLLHSGLRLEDGQLHWSHSRRFDLGDELRRAITEALAAADRLAAPQDLTASLAAVARHDPLPAVRRQALAELAGRTDQEPVAEAALREALEDPDDDARVIAAAALGPDGHQTLVTIAGRPGTATGTAARAVTALGPHLPLDLASTVLDRASHRGQRDLAVAVVRGLGEVGGPSAITRLAALSADHGSELARHAVDALGLTDDTMAEEPLLAVTAHGSSELRLRAATALERVGTVSAVPVLREVMDAHPLDRAFRRAARTAIAAIQSRLEGAEAGQLTLARADGGELALADAEAGELSLSQSATLEADEP